MRAFENLNYDYYRLKKRCFGLPEGAIFYHDKYDQELGNIGTGCLKLCWTQEGNCYKYFGDTFILHADAKDDTEYLELVKYKNKSKELINELKKQDNAKVIHTYGNGEEIYTIVLKGD